MREIPLSDTEAPRTVIGTLEAFATASVVRAPQNAHLDEGDDE